MQGLLGVSILALLWAAPDARAAEAVMAAGLHPDTARPALVLTSGKDGQAKKPKKKKKNKNKNKNKGPKTGVSVGPNGAKLRVGGQNGSVKVGPGGASVSVKPKGSPVRIGIGPNGPRLGINF